MTNIITDEEYNNKKKMVQLNTYNEKQYASYLNVLKYFTIYCVVLLILGILRKRFILSPSFTNILSLGLVIVGGIHLYILIADINARNNMNFDEYDWTFDPSKQSDPNKLDTNLHDTAEDNKMSASCVEDDCCDPPNTKWCRSQGVCVKGSDYEQSVCEVSGTDGGSSNNTEYNINWNTTPDDCDFPSKNKCGSDPSKPFYCPVTDSCVNTLTTECKCASYEDGSKPYWCPHEGTCVFSACKTQPCDPTTASIQSDCGPGKQKCVGGPDDGLCRRIGLCAPVETTSTTVNCAEVTGSEHANCVNDSGNHHETFVSGIANSFKNFTNSLGNRKRIKADSTTIKSFSKLDNNFSSV